MASLDKNTRTLQEHWKSVHLTVFYSSLLLATIMFVVVLFFGETPPPMTLKRKIFLYTGAYSALFVVGMLINYIFFYIPNYMSYKRMMKDGREKEIRRMIEEHGLEKLIGRDWFIFKKKTKQEKHSKSKPNDAGDEQ